MGLIALSALMSGCSKGGGNEPGEVKSFVVTGTDGGMKEPANIDPAQNGGRFLADYNVIDGHDLQLSLQVKFSDGNQVEIDRICCTGTACETGTFSCTVTAASSVSCTGPGQAVTQTQTTDLSKFRNESSSSAPIVLETLTYACADIQPPLQRGHSASNDAIFR